MELKAQETYKYFYEDGKQGHDVKIERTCLGSAYATSEAVGDMGPFTMKFNASTGEGKGQYVGTHLEEYAEGEIYTETFAVTFEHTNTMFRDHTVTVKVRKDENMLEEAHKAMDAQNLGLSNINGYKPEPTAWKEV